MILRNHTTNFGGCPFELVELVPFPFSRGRSTRYSDRLHDFWVTLTRFYKNVFSIFPTGIVLNEYSYFETDGKISRGTDDSITL